MRKLIFLTLCIFLLNGKANAEDSSQWQYNSINNGAAFSFYKTGDFEARLRIYNNNGRYIRGVYQMGEAICSNPDINSITPSGNVILYYDNVQCCLKWQNISDKVTLSLIWPDHPVGLCTNHVLTITKGHD